MKSKNNLSKPSTKLSLDKRSLNKSKAEENICLSMKKNFNKSIERLVITNTQKDIRKSSYDLGIARTNLNTTNSIIRKSSELDKKNNRNSSIALLDMQVTNMSDFYQSTKTYSNSTFGKYINNLAMKRTIDNHTVNSSSITANTLSASKTLITNKIKTNKNLIINKLSKSLKDNNILLKFHNSLTISKDDDELLPTATRIKLHVNFYNKGFKR